MRKKLFCLVLLLFCLAGCFDLDDEDVDNPAVSGQMRVVMLDVGQGDAILVISPNGQTMLVDGGNSAGDARDVILPYLKNEGIERLNVMVLTHPDADHVGGLPTVLKNIPVDVVVSTGQTHTTQVYAEFLQELKKARDEGGTRVIRGVAGAEVPFDEAVQVQVLRPDSASVQGDDLNHASIVLRLTFGQVSVLLTGDAEENAEKWLIDQGGDLRAQILKVSHHGSKTGSSDAFLNAVRPEIALISCEADNRYGHPHAEVLERLARRKIKVYRTDQAGTVEVTVDGQGYRVRSDK